MWDIERICALASVHIDMCGDSEHTWDSEHICGIVSIYVGY